MGAIFSPFISKPDTVSRIMFKVLLALVPGIALYVWYYGPAILVSLTLASLTALGTEALMLKLRNRPIAPFLKDNSALVTGWLLALSIPSLAPWWLIVVGTAFSIAIVKHLYGGLGNNPFSPAMAGFAVLIISFPVQMTQWISPHGLGAVELGFLEQLEYIFPICNNPFSPAMAGFAVLIISFPVQMTQWISPHGLGAVELGFLEQLEYIF